MGFNSFIDDKDENIIKYTQFMHDETKKLNKIYNNGIIVFKIAKQNWNNFNDLNNNNNNNNKNNNDIYNIHKKYLRNNDYNIFMKNEIAKLKDKYKNENKQTYEHKFKPQIFNMAKQNWISHNIDNL